MLRAPQDTDAVAAHVEEEAALVAATSADSVHRLADHIAYTPSGQP
jgi:hypothetical protein